MVASVLARVLATTRAKVLKFLKWDMASTVATSTMEERYLFLLCK